MPFEERLLLVISIATHIQPAFFNYAFNNIVSKEMDPDFEVKNPETGLIRGTLFKGLMPSGLTFLYLSSGSNMESRLKNIELLLPGGTLIKEKVVHLESSRPGDPFFSGPLIFSKAYFASFLTTINNLKTIYVN